MKRKNNELICDIISNVKPWDKIGFAVVQPLTNYRRIKWHYPKSKKDSLWDFRTDENGKYLDEDDTKTEWLEIDYCDVNGIKYPLSEIFCETNPFWSSDHLEYTDKAGKRHIIGGSETFTIFNPILFEITEMETFKAFKLIGKFYE